ncbi:hypothetical protein ACFSM5_21150 [Lacibacterium aquatile]|uniref:Uncharacterized protein n=1 Tax=Lacibacterium aquatile TaxID=1168082 RepID=A0ABW5E060_9PROT
MTPTDLPGFYIQDIGDFLTTPAVRIRFLKDALASGDEKMMVYACLVLRRILELPVRQEATPTVSNLMEIASALGVQLTVTKSKT